MLFFRDKDIEFSATCQISADNLRKVINPEMSEDYCSYSQYWDLTWVDNVPLREHRKKRINKKWLKRYGTKVVRKFLNKCRIKEIKVSENGGLNNGEIVFEVNLNEQGGSD